MSICFGNKLQVTFFDLHINAIVLFLVIILLVIIQVLKI